MNKETKNKIKQLRKQKKYDEIFINYGRKEYIKNTPRSYQKKEIRKLKNEGRYEDVFCKYGENEYNELLLHARTQEIKEAKGFLKAYSWGCLQRIKMLMIYIVSVFLGTSALVMNSAQMLINENGVKYEKEIEDYNENVDKYAEKVKKMQLNDLQIIMKVMDDMWNNIQGYGVPQKDIFGYMELDLATKDGYGVCRNMASDIAKKLNQINPKYNARTINVTIVAEGNYYLADIETKELGLNENPEENAIGINENIEERKDTILETGREVGKEILGKVLGNHMVTLIDIPEKDIILVADPTNPSIGLYKNGKIKMFNSDKEYVTNEVSTTLYKGYDGLETVEDFVDSFTNDKSYEKLKEKYGVEQQNEALEYVRNLEKEKEEYKESLKIGYVPQISVKVSNHQVENKPIGKEDIEL